MLQIIPLFVMSASLPDSRNKYYGAWSVCPSKQAGSGGGGIRAAQLTNLAGD
jgi:hypothetical protein